MQHNPAFSLSVHVYRCYSVDTLCIGNKRLMVLLSVFCFCFQNVIDRKPYPDDENLVEVKFATTPTMSTYLVAFVIGEYDYVESQSSDGITVRVYTPVGKAEQGKFALEVRTLLQHFDIFSHKVTADSILNLL